MKVNPTMNPERKNEIRRFQRKIHESIQAAFNDRFTINSNSYAMDTAITQLNILKQQTEDSGERSMKIEPLKFHVIEQIEQSTFHSKISPNEGELNVETVEKKLTMKVDCHQNKNIQENQKKLT